MVAKVNRQTVSITFRARPGLQAYLAEIQEYLNEHSIGEGPHSVSEAIRFSIITGFRFSRGHIHETFSCGQSGPKRPRKRNRRPA
jgi:hypothetical protein